MEWDGMEWNGPTFLVELGAIGIALQFEVPAAERGRVDLFPRFAVHKVVVFRIEDVPRKRRVLLEPTGARQVARDAANDRLVLFVPNVEDLEGALKRDHRETGQLRELQRVIGPARVCRLAVECLDFGERGARFHAFQAVSQGEVRGVFRKRKHFEEQIDRALFALVHAVGVTFQHELGRRPRRGNVESIRFEQFVVLRVDEVDQIFARQVPCYRC